MKETLAFSAIEDAARRIANRVARTPFVQSRTLSEIVGADVWIKLENLQFTASFKERGAANRLLTLAPDEAKRGVYFDRTGLGVYFAWLRAAYEVTYGDFFAELRAAAKSKPGGGTQAQ